jgi:hypothetical protein
MNLQSDFEQRNPKPILCQHEQLRQAVTNQERRDCDRPPPVQPTNVIACPVASLLHCTALYRTFSALPLYYSFILSLLLHQFGPHTPRNLAATTCLYPQNLTLYSIATYTPRIRIAPRASHCTLHPALFNPTLKRPWCRQYPSRPHLWNLRRLPPPLAVHPTAPLSHATGRIR